MDDTERDLTLTGRRALVTGGSRGIGAAIVGHLAELGADVAFTWRVEEQRAAEVAGHVRGLGREAIPIRADSASATEVVDAVDLAAERLGGLDVMVNNAGIFSHGPIDGVEVEEVDRLLAVHVRAVYLASQAAARHLGRGGRVISIGSNLAERASQPGLALYAMSKSALSGFTRGLARDLGGRGIAVTLVQPGSTDTDMNPADQADDVERAQIALGHYGEAIDVARMVGFLAGPGGRHVTGTSISVDGGANA